MFPGIYGQTNHEPVPSSLISADIVARVIYPKEKPMPLD